MLLFSHLLLVMTTCWLVSGQTEVPTVPCYGPDCAVTKSTTESTTEGSTSTTSTTPPTTTSTTPPTTTPPSGSIQRTVVFIYKVTQPNQDMFIRGGIDSDIVRPTCQGDQDAETSKCAITIEVNSLGTGTSWQKYNAWRIGDTKLDWYGAQKGQGTYNGLSAEGTPMAWTTDKPAAPEYQPLNKWGDAYWMVDFEMDCSETEMGWFDFKAFLTNFGWESNIVQYPCSGPDGSDPPPYTGTKNHMARCGFINRFNFNTGSCEIIAF